MTRLKILITNTTLAERSGTVLYVRDLALQLLARGHTPILYSPRLGAMATEIRDATIPVTDDLDSLSRPPDVIHGQHALETMTALLRFPRVPAVYFAHDWYQTFDKPPRFPRILRYAAIDQPCHDMLVFERAVPPERAHLLLGFVDLERFRPRPPLPTRPRRALLFSNYSQKDEYFEAIRTVCANAGLTLDVMGTASGTCHPRPEAELAAYDLVFAKGRCAVEALAVGTAVVLYVLRHVGPMVRAAEVERLLPLNFGIRAMGPPLAPAEIAAGIEREIARYDCRDAAEASRLLRERIGSGHAVDEIIALYREVIAEGQTLIADPDAEARAVADYLRHLQVRHHVVATRLPGAAVPLRQRLARLPVLGPLARRVARLASS